MALRDQPYIPLYIQDFLTDEKLIECSAQATGVYVRLMCIMHKSEDYGKLLIKQKDKQRTNQIENFAIKLAKQMPYSEQVINDSLVELLNEQVLYIELDFLCQKRMISDNKLSLIRASAGQKGGKLAQAKIQSNNIAKTENESVVVIDNEINEEIEQWKFWGNEILIGNDFGWANMRGRSITPDELDSFLSVATRNEWKMGTQQAFRTSLHGFKINGFGTKDSAPKKSIPKLTLDDLKS